ncbi:Uncharacterised protein [Candidatus Gugararchaeum adminiculabundum]|nr:Uncharacterised protein [Candidatus Gugararchaeum adminiculabundum]
MLESLLTPGALEPNVSEIKRQTGLNHATVQSSLDFFKESGAVKGFSPDLDLEKFGFNLEVLTVFQADMSNKRIADKFFDSVKSDPHFIYASGVAGATNWNVLSRQLFRDVDAYLADIQGYYNRMPELYELIQDKAVFYARKPLYKKELYSRTAINLLKKEKNHLNK